MSLVSHRVGFKVISPALSPFPKNFVYYLSIFLLILLIMPCILHIMNPFSNLKELWAEHTKYISICN